ncbi:MAG TPA: hypothetical protein EYO51_00430 [Methylococcaceae bacterium]|nr:hypothetical protein [Methylococcaceae bacterium]
MLDVFNLNAIVGITIGVFESTTGIRIIIVYLYRNVAIVRFSSIIPKIVVVIIASSNGDYELSFVIPPPLVLY